MFFYLASRQAKLADFGRSYLQGSDCNAYTEPHGVIPYIDPKIFNIKETESYNLTKKSDIYGLGVLLWELTSCSSPFNIEEGEDDAYLIKLVLAISNGKREKPISNTNDEFVKLYQSK